MLMNGDFCRPRKMFISLFIFIDPLLGQEKIFCVASRQKEFIQAIF
jgi:hypothetical protein